MKSPREGWLDGWRLCADLGHQALLSLGDRRLRTSLSVLGIAIGIAAVILIGVVSRGGKQLIFSELETFGLKSAWIFRDRRVLDPKRVVREGSGISNEDLSAARSSKCCPNLQNISPIVYGGKGSSRFVRSGGRYAPVQVEGIGHEYLVVNNDEVVRGRAFTEMDIDSARNQAVIGEQVWRDLYPGVSNPIGKELVMGDVRFTVTGLLKRKDRNFLSSIGSADGNSANSRVLISYRRMQAINGNDRIDLLQAELAPGADRHAFDQIKDFLRRRSKGAFEYKVESMEQYADTANNILNGVSAIGAVAASVSLFVAGLGILNIMSTSVMERTREIGLRKAVGATAREILLQFLFEASAISLLGGVIGLVLGAAGSAAIAAIVGFPLQLSMPLIGVALTVALGVGIVSGIYPAYRAARLRPVEALRYE